MLTLLLLLLWVLGQMNCRMRQCLMVVVAQGSVEMPVEVVMVFAVVVFQTLVLCLSVVSRSVLSCAFLFRLFVGLRLVEFLPPVFRVVVAVAV